MGAEGIHLRPVGDDELGAYLWTTEVGFGDVVEAALVEEERSVLPLDRTVAAFDGPDIVGTASSYPFELTVPGGASVPVAGVTGVGVLPTHRRRGILTSMMEAQLADVADRGEVAAVLIASEGAIYRRFGYGVAVEQQVVEVDPRRFELATSPADTRLRLVDRQRARALLPPLYETFRQHRPGALSRSPRWWDLLVGEVERWRGGGKLFYVVAEPTAAHAGGYAVYAMEELPDFRFRAKVRELVAVDPDVEAALWRFCARIDLVQVVEVSGRPLDDPIRWRTDDPRAVRVARQRDQLWVRLLDVPAALEARSWAGEGELVLEVLDATCPQVAGCYRLSAGDGRGRCRPTSERAHLTVDVAELGSLYLGGVSATTLGRARRVVEHRPGALALADRLFATAVAPSCTTFF